MELLSQRSKTQANGDMLYEYEYELSSTRGRKRILNVVCISDSRLFIVNGQVKCNKDACGIDDEPGIQTLRQCVDTFQVL